MEPKFVPVIVISEPIVAEEPERLVMLGTGMTVNGTPLDVPFEVVTTMLPVVAALGTGTTMLVGPQVGPTADVPLNVIVLDPWEEPKLTPEIVTEVPEGPELGDTLLIVGVRETTNGIPLLATPPTVTTTFPEVAAIGTGTAMPVVLQ
jgi:hypothetical protein